MKMTYILLKQYILNLNNLVTTHHSHQILIDVGHDYIQLKKIPKNLSLHETHGGASKTCTLNFKGRKDVVGEGINIKKRLIFVHNRSI